MNMVERRLPALLLHLALCSLGGPPFAGALESVVQPAEKLYNYTTEYFNQRVSSALSDLSQDPSSPFFSKVDHFSFVNGDVFKQRYLVNDSFWDSSAGGPIFFYTGNEGDIEAFAQNTVMIAKSAGYF